MATRYPAVFVDGNNDTRIQGYIEFTDPTTTPVFSGGTLTRPLVVDLSAYGGGAVPLTVIASYQAQSHDFFDVINSDTNTRLFAVDPNGGTIAYPHSTESGGTTLTGSGSLPLTGGLPGVVGTGATGARSVGFYDALPVARQTGVPVTAAAIHAALVNLGLITA
jgi:hypothetical protein